MLFIIHQLQDKKKTNSILQMPSLVIKYFRSISCQSNWSESEREAEGEIGTGGRGEEGAGKIYSSMLESDSGEEGEECGTQHSTG